jgi:hypothetical protein
MLLVRRGMGRQLNRRAKVDTLYTCKNYDVESARI